MLAAVVVCLGIGLWLGAMPDVPLKLQAGLLVGAAAGAGAAFLLVHDFHHEQATVRARRRSH